MDARQALQILLKDSLLFPPQMKKEIAEKVPEMSMSELQSIGKVLVLEVQKRPQLTEEQKAKLDLCIAQLKNSTEAE